MEKSLRDIANMLKQTEMMTPEGLHCTATDCNKNNYCNAPTPRSLTGGILTMAFVDMQPLNEVYELDEAFKNGTLFPNINKPFLGGRKR